MRFVLALLFFAFVALLALVLWQDEGDRADTDREGTAAAPPAREGGAGAAPADPDAPATPDATAAPDAPAPVTLEGRVVDADGGAVAATVRAGRQAAVATDADGRFRLRFAPAGPFVLAADAEELGQAVYGAAFGWDTGVVFDLPPGTARRDLVVAFGRPTRVAGRLTGGAGANVRLALAGGDRSFQARADDAGAFALRVPLHRARAASLRFLAPDAAYPELARVLAPGDHVDLGELAPLAAGTIAGRVVTSFGAPVPDASVQAGPHAATTDQEGRFSVRIVAPGDVEITASRPLPDEATAPRTVVVAPGATVADLVLTLRPVLALRGTVRDRDGGARAGVKVAARREGAAGLSLSDAPWTQTDSRGRFSLRVLHGPRYEVGLVGRAVDGDVFLDDPPPAFATPSDGALEFVVAAARPPVVVGRCDPDGAAGRARLTLVRVRGAPLARNVALGAPDAPFEVELPQAGAWAAALHVGGRLVVRGAPFDVAPGERVDLGVLRSQAAALRGVVRGPDGAPAPHARVFLTDPATGRAWDEAFADAAGAYAFARVAAGRYTVVAVAPDRAPGARAALEVRGAATADVMLPAAATLVCRVVDDASGEPVRDASVSYATEAFAAHPLRRLLPPSHRARRERHVVVLPFVPAGSVRVRAAAPGRAPVERRVRVEPGGEHEVELRLP